MLTATDWRGNQIDPAKLLTKYHLTLTQFAGKCWQIVELRETHGRPELRQIVLGTTDSVTFSARSNAGLVFDALHSSMKEEGNLMVFGVNAGSYYYPRREAGPWTMQVADGPSDVISGLGLAVDPAGDNPGQDDDSRYLTVQVAWKSGDGGVIQPPPPPPVDPPAEPSIELAAVQAYIDKRINERLADVFNRIKAAL